MTQDQGNPSDELDKLSDMKLSGDVFYSCAPKCNQDKPRKLADMLLEENDFSHEAYSSMAEVAVKEVERVIDEELKESNPDIQSVLHYLKISLREKLL